MPYSRAVDFPACVAGQASVLAAMTGAFSQALACAGPLETLVERLKNEREILEKHDQELLSGDFEREDWITVSRAFCRCGEEIALTARDMASWGAKADRFVLRLVGLLQETIARVADVFGSSGAMAQASLAEAKSRSLEVQAVFRRARAAVLESPEAVESLKLREIYRRLSEAGLATDKAIESLAGVAADGGDRRSGHAHKAN